MARGKQHVGLGKGLGDLFARTDEENTRDTTAPSDRLRDGSYFVELPLDQIVPNPRQPRHVFEIGRASWTRSSPIPGSRVTSLTRTT